MKGPPGPPSGRSHWHDVLRARFDSLTSSAADFESVIEELAQHLESAEADLRARGVTEEEARRQLTDQLRDDSLRAVVQRRAAARAPSSLAVAHVLVATTRGTRLIVRLAEAIADLRFGMRTLARERAFTAFVVIVLALGIGANAAMFGVLDRLLLRGPLHVRDAGQLRRVISTTHPVGRPMERTGYLTYAQYEAFRADSSTFAAVGAYNLLRGNMFGRRERARPVSRASATGNFFALLGVRPVLGRFFTEVEDDPDAPERVVVLGYRFWQSEFGGDSSVLGRSVHLDYAMYTVIGVAPRGFTGVDLAPVDVWVPESGVPHSTNWRTIWYWPWLHVVVRIRPGISTEQASASLTRLHRNGYQGRSDVARNAALSAEPIHFTYAGAEGTQTRLSRWLFGVSGAVLLIACANVVNLMVARTMKRRRELALRLALGAGRFRLLRLLTMEAMLLAVAGGAAGIAVAFALGQAARVLIPDIEWTAPVNADIVGAIAALAVITGALVGFMPAVHGSAIDPGAALRSGVREGGGRTAWFRSALTVMQTALSVVLLVGAGLFVRSFLRASTLELGLDTERLIAFRVDHVWPALADGDTAGRRREVARQEAFFPMAAERLRHWPDVERVGLAASLPFVRQEDHPIAIPGRDSIPVLPGGGPFVTAVSSDYFRVVGTPIVRGRGFAADDRAGSTPVAVISETAARTLWPNENAIGRCVVVAQGPECATIVGIAADTRRKALREDPAIEVYVPREQRRIGGDPMILVRTSGEVSSVAATVRQELLRLDPSILYVYVSLPHQEVVTQIRPWRLGASVFALFGALALIVAGVGLYSVVSYLVTQRRREIGVRIALGAQPWDITRMVVADGLILVGGGLAVGLVLSVIGGRGLASLLFATSPTDPVIFMLVIVTIAGVAMAAASSPALRARRVDPLEALRIE